MNNDDLSLPESLWGRRHRCVRAGPRSSSWLTRLWIPCWTWASRHRSSSSAGPCTQQERSGPVWKGISSETAVSKSYFIYHQHVFDRSQRKRWLITKLFVIKQGLFFFVIYHKTFCYCYVGMQECFVINCGKGCFCDGCLWLITDVYDKLQKNVKS